ncbi:hypothetical protein EV359DRAFT_51738, partial [Lentinula novae-zelandiae]
MTVGKITIETLEAAKKDLRIFLTNNRKLIPADYVSRCLNVWEDPRVSNWIEQNREKFSELSFEDFFIAVRDRVLDPDWRDSTFRKMRAVHMPDDLSTSASDLAVDLLILNGYLKGTRSYQSDESLKSMLEAAIDPGLYHAFAKEVEDQASNPNHGIHSKDFDTFTRALQSLDHSRHIQLRMACQMAEQMIRSRPGSRATTPFTSSSAGNRPTQRPTNSSTMGSQNAVPRGRLPPLTATERRLLGENDGCFKCRSFFVKCRTSSEEHEFAIPNGTGYKELTIADVEAARKLRGPNQDGHKKARITTTIATIGTEDDDDVVASITPSAVLGSGTDSEEEVSAPFRVPHLRWKCHVSGPKAQFPVIVNSLIDNGAHLALIHPELADRLGYPRLRLSQPEKVSAAFQNGGGASTVPALTEYINLKVSSTDGIFVSRSVPFIIAPGLCTQLLIGLPWLSHKNIIIDYSSRSCIHKPSGYDLLSPIPVPRKRPFELKSFESVQIRIDQLAISDVLKSKEDTLKQQYKSIFEPIPHVDDLPTSVTAKIELKDASKAIAARSYRCPRKFRAAWQ